MEEKEVQEHRYTSGVSVTRDTSKRFEEKYKEQKSGEIC